MNNNDQLILARVQALVARGARLYTWDGEPAVALQAVEWIPGKGLLYAVRGTIDQSGVHLLAADQLTNEGSTVIEESTEFDLLGAGGDLLASIYPTTADDAPVPTDEAFALAWAAEIQRRKEGEE